MAKKLKDMIKKNPVANPTFGTDPSNPWATKYNVTEATEAELLARYLNSRGVNPHFVTRDTKIAHAKSAEYAKWKADHIERFAREEVQLQEADKVDTITVDIPLMIRLLEYAREDAKTDMDLHKVTENLIDIRGKGVLSMADYEYIVNTKKKVKEEVEIDEGTQQILRKFVPGYAKHQLNKKMDAQVYAPGDSIKKTVDKDINYGRYKKIYDKLKKEEVEQIDELSPATMASYVLKTSSKDPNRAEPRKKIMSKLAKTMAKQPVDPKAPRYSTNIVGEEKKMTALDKFRKAAAEREKKHAEIEKKQSKDGSGMTAAIDRLEKHLNKEETLDELNYDTVKSLYNKRRDDFHGDQVGKKKKGKEVSAKNVSRSISRLMGFKPTQKEEVVNEITQSDVDKSAEDENAHAKKLGWKVHDGYHHRTYDHPKHGHIDMDRYGEWQHRPKAKITGVGTGDLIARGQSHELNKHLSSLKEEVEQIDEISKSTLASYKDKSTASLKNAQANRDAAEFGKHMSKGFADLHAKSDVIAKKRVKGLIGYMQRKQGMKPTSEDAFQDTYAATQMPFDGANTTNDTSIKREMSKSARIIKSIYKRKNMKEELADWEKEDKSVQTYGKKPKLDMTDKKSNIGENKPEARAVMTGGKTLTGQDRDMVEIDPSMKTRPDRPDTFDKGYPKKSPA